jgi:hypothetical protein
MFLAKLFAELLDKHFYNHVADLTYCQTLLPKHLAEILVIYQPNFFAHHFDHRFAQSYQKWCFDKNTDLMLLSFRRCVDADRFDPELVLRLKRIVRKRTLVRNVDALISR